MNAELLPHLSQCADDLCLVRSMHTEAINHEPAITFIQTGNQVTGKPCLGSWVSYGLGSLNQNLPTFVVLVAEPSNKEQIQAISGKLWTSGYLPGEHAGVAFRSKGDPILYINNPRRRDRRGPAQDARRAQLAEPDELRRGGRSRDAHAHFAIRDGVPHAGERAGAGRPLEGRRGAPSTCTARKRRSRARSPTPRCSRGGWSSAACASCRSTTTTGTTTPTSPAACPTSAATSISPAPA